MMQQLSKDIEDPMVLPQGQFPLAPVGPREDSITQAHVGKGELLHILDCGHIDILQ